MNPNLPILAEHFRCPVTRVEQHWHASKRLSSAEGRKKDYLFAWHAVMHMLGREVPLLKLGGHVHLWGRKATIIECDAKFVTLTMVDEHPHMSEYEQQSVLPVSLLYLHVK